MVHTAGMVRGRKGRKAAASDWMSMEQERGISITASAMQFPYKYGLNQTFRHQYTKTFLLRRITFLTAADCAIMVIDVAKGV